MECNEVRRRASTANWLGCGRGGVLRRGPGLVCADLACADLSPSEPEGGGGTELCRCENGQTAAEIRTEKATMSWKGPCDNGSPGFWDKFRVLWCSFRWSAVLGWLLRVALQRARICFLGLGDGRVVPSARGSEFFSLLLAASPSAYFRPQDGWQRRWGG